VALLPLPEKGIAFAKGLFLEKRRNVMAVLGPQRPEQWNLLQEDFGTSHLLPFLPVGLSL
jgi:hypothetical protein